MNRVKGFGVTEYIVGLIGVMFIFLVPYVNGESVATMLINAVKKEHSAYIYAQSLNNLPDVYKPKKRKP